MRCQAHGLAAAADGLCVVCRRRPGTVIDAGGDGGAVHPVKLYLAMGAVGVVLATTGIAYRLATEPSAPIAAASAPAASGGVHVTIYTMSSCAYCRKAKSFFRARGIAFEERDVEANPENAAAARSLSGHAGVPVIDVDGEILPGYNEVALTMALEKARKKGGG